MHIVQALHTYCVMATGTHHSYNKSMTLVFVTRMPCIPRDVQKQREVNLGSTLTKRANDKKDGCHNSLKPTATKMLPNTTKNSTQATKMKYQHALEVQAPSKT